jgi:hypothetical protein
MGRQKLGNKNAQANNNAKHNYNQEFSSEFKANQASSSVLSPSIWSMLLSWVSQFLYMI